MPSFSQNPGLMQWKMHESVYMSAALVTQAIADAINMPKFVQDDALNALYLFFIYILFDALH